MREMERWGVQISQKISQKFFSENFARGINPPFLCYNTPYGRGYGGRPPHNTGYTPHTVGGHCYNNARSHNNTLSVITQRRPYNNTP